MTPTNCIYHSRDLDGWTSAAIIQYKYPDVKLIGYDYGQAIPKTLVKGPVIMVDVAFPMEEMYKLSIEHELIWIDHHISSIKEFGDAVEQSGEFMIRFTNPRIAACELTWHYLFPDTPMPEPVRLLGMYDSFRHKGKSEELKVLKFQYYARSIASDPNEAAIFISDLFDMKKAMIGGDAIYQYLCVEAEGIYRKGFPMEFDGHVFIAFNRERFNPVNFGINYHSDGWAGSACFWYSGNGKWTFSLYNDDGKVDCSEICKKHGGGGHKGAAGFVVNTNELIMML